MNIKELKWSHHATADRTERMMAILMTVGMGEIKYCREGYKAGRLRALTDTGVFLIIDKSSKLIITAFVGTFDQVSYYFDGKIPLQIQKAVKTANKAIIRYMESH